jgi:hypothetical protein
VRCLLIVLLPVLITNVFGFLLLSHLLRLSILLCSCFGLVLYTLVHVAMTRMPRVRTLASVRLQEVTLITWTKRLLKLSAGFCWIVVTLNLLAADEASRGMIASLLNARPGTRAFDFSIGDLLAFSGVLLVGCLIARGVRLSSVGRFCHTGGSREAFRTRFRARPIMCCSCWCSSCC